MEDQYASANNRVDIECANPITEVEVEVEDDLEYFDGRQISKLFHLEELKISNEEDYYTPKIVSFGPYYHGRPELGRVQELKHEILTMQISRNGKDKKVFYDQIFKVIDKIRNCYVGVSKDTWDDGALTEMMLLDASFAACIMRTWFGDITTLFYVQEKLGYLALPFVSKDMCLIDNQIPLWVIMHFCKLIFSNEDDGRAILYAFIGKLMVHLDGEILRIPGEDKKLPLHLLDAIYRLLVQDLDNAQLVQPVKKCQWLKSFPFSRWMNREENQNLNSALNRQFRSVVDLKAKGIHFKPSSHCLNDIDFKSYAFYGQLQFPVWFFTEQSKLLFIHLVAYELQPQRSARPDSPFPYAVLSYINFLKSLVLKSEDVRELRERKILFSDFDSDEQVLQVIKEIDTLRDDFALKEVKMRIEDHCSSKAKTWIAELIHTYFRNPWTSIALLAATALLILTFLQTYYTMKYPK